MCFSAKKDFHVTRKSYARLSCNHIDNLQHYESNKSKGNSQHDDGDIVTAEFTYVTPTLDVHFPLNIYTAHIQTWIWRYNPTNIGKTTKVKHIHILLQSLSKTNLQQVPVGTF